jgi:hypothetical protein
MAERKRYHSFIADSARWDGFEFRDDDVVISTPPKCGTTWMQMMCAVLIFRSPELPQPLTECSPWLDMLTEPLADVRAKLDAQEHRRFIKTHTPLDGVPDDPRVTYIGVGRDPRDVAVSWFHHVENIDLDKLAETRFAAVGADDLADLNPDAEPPDGDPATALRRWIDSDIPPTDDLNSLGSVMHHLDTFWERRDDDHLALFHYSDMQADRAGELRRLATVLGIEIDDGERAALAEAVSFAAMSARAEQLAPESTKHTWHDTQRFFRAGTSGQWRDVFTAEDLQRYDERLDELSAPDLVAWATYGGRGAAAG